MISCSNMHHSRSTMITKMSLPCKHWLIDPFTRIYIYIYLRSSTNCIIPLGSWIARIMSQSVAFALGWKNNDSIVFSHCRHDNAQREAHPLNGPYQISCCHNGTTDITEHASHPGALACRTRFFMMPISRHISFGLSILTPWMIAGRNWS